MGYYKYYIYKKNKRTLKNEPKSINWIKRNRTI